VAVVVFGTQWVWLFFVKILARSAGIMHDDGGVIIIKQELACLVLSWHSHATKQGMR